MDIDENPTLAESANVRGVPTIAIYENGKLVESIVGYQDKDFLQKKMGTNFKVETGKKSWEIFDQCFKPYGIRSNLRF